LGFRLRKKPKSGEGRLVYESKLKTVRLSVGLAIVIISLLLWG
jgi:hypothetical protein